MGNPTDERQSARTISLKINCFNTYSERNHESRSVKIKVSIQTKTVSLFLKPTFTLFQLLFYKPVPVTSALWLREHAGSVGF